LGLGALVNQLDPAMIHVNDFWWVSHTVRAIASRRSNPSLLLPVLHPLCIT
jgi:hypothetical protein